MTDGGFPRFAGTPSDKNVVVTMDTISGAIINVMVMAETLPVATAWPDLATEYAIVYAENERRFKEQINLNREPSRAEIECRIGLLYFHGLDGLPCDWRAALRWWDFAAERGSMAAEAHIGSFFAKGGPLAYSEAERHYIKATRKNPHYRRVKKLTEALKQLPDYSGRRQINSVEESMRMAQDVVQHSNATIVVTPLRYSLLKPIIFEKACRLLAEDGIAEQDCPLLAGAIVQLVENYRRNPAAVKAVLAATITPRTIEAVSTAPEAGRVVQDVERGRSSGPDDPERASVHSQHETSPDEAPAARRGRKATVHYSPDEIREARRIVSWRSRHKDTPLDEDTSINPDDLRKANRVVRWADREKQRQNRSKSMGVEISP